ncbi:uncharacterized protein c16h19orf85 [Sparus aurata]|uniref:uncharacterized protein c16h19orf85 n=1 Tax=Sparus aurata TaxID=8175 RepID=UPI0011C13D9F|nr:uncharacterized protein LOC115566979 [Sparus aurata]
MRPSISVTLEPGLERGVPWGRDLYTFVTSAAGHMMRTLQKPRKNRPSKRQVNHRRFLHNMIQRKFADIEAANHRLASALYFKEEGKNVTSPASQEPETPDHSGSSSPGGCLQDPDKCSGHTVADGISKSNCDVSIGSHEAEISENEELDSGHLSKQHPRSQAPNQSKGGQNKGSRNPKLVEATSMSSLSINHHEAELFHTESHDDQIPLKSANSLSDDSQKAQQESGFSQNVDMSPVFSPQLSPLSLDSCDFTDTSTCTEVQRNIADISEAQWTDILDFFSVGSMELGSCVDVEAYFESICACQGEAGQEVGAEVENLHCEAGECRYDDGYSCHADQSLTINHFLRQNEDASETQFNSFKPPGIIDQLQTSVNLHCTASELQTYQHPQEESSCMLVNNQNFRPFEGVAQSFSAPLLIPELRPIPTPPHEDDWLFTDILKDWKSLDF